MGNALLGQIMDAQDLKWIADVKETEHAKETLARRRKGEDIGAGL